MASNPAPGVRRDHAAADSIAPNLQAEYAHLREKLQRLMASPVKNLPAIDELVNRLEMLQLAIKGEHGIKGNNPNE